MKILVALDPFGASQPVVAEVTGCPWPERSEMRIVSVLEPTQPWVLTPTVEAVLQRAQTIARRAEEGSKSHGLLAEGIVLQGDPKAMILQQAKDWPADLIAVGAHGGGALETFLLGSVSRAIIRHAPCSVQVVRSFVPQSAEHYTEKYKILLAVDGSEGSAGAAKAIAENPWPTWTEVRVLSAVELHLGFFRAAFEIPGMDPSHLEPQKEHAMRHAQEAVHGALKILEPAGLRTSESISILLEPPKQIILQEAVEWGANLIVLGSHGSGGVSRFLLGSTSETVATHAKCSVRVVR